MQRAQKLPGTILGRRAREARPKIAKSVQGQSLAQEAVLSRQVASKKRSLRNRNIHGHGRWRNLKGLVRRQAANTSLNHDQGSIILSFLFDLCIYLYFCSSSCLQPICFFAKYANLFELFGRGGF